MISLAPQIPVLQVCTFMISFPLPVAFHCCELTPVTSGFLCSLCSTQEIDLPPLEPEISSVSTPLGVKLAKHLTAAGAKMYGAFWCSHCYDQKLV